MKTIIFNKNTFELIAFIDDESDSIVNNDYVYLRCNNAEPTIEMRDKKLYVRLETVKIERGENK